MSLVNVKLLVNVKWRIGSLRTRGVEVKANGG